MSGFEFHFLRPLWLLMLAPLALLLWRLLRAGGDGDAWRAVVDAHLLPRLLVDSSHRVRRLPLLLLGLGWLLIVLALAGPVWERLPEPLYQARQYRVVVLDLSPSMNATDVAPSRLVRARFEVLDLLRQYDEGQTALLAYGAEPYVVSPLTTDAATIAAQVPNLETDLLPVGGARRTDAALDLAAQLLRQAEAPQGQVILIGDGAQPAAAAAEAARRLRDEGYRVSVLAVGTARGGPVAAPDGKFLRDASGAIRLPKLDAAALQDVADAGGGRYVVARPDDRDIAALAVRGSATPGEQAAESHDRAARWREEGPWLLLALLPLAALAFRRGWLSPLALAICVLPAPDAYALTWDELWLRPDQRARQLLETGLPDAAAKVFERTDWRAAAQYRASDYEQALQSLQELSGPDVDYNRGNTLARLGRLEEAVAAYDRSLTADPGDPDARHNRDLVQGLIEQRRQASQPQDRRQSAERQQASSEQSQSQEQSGDSEQQSEQAQSSEQSQGQEQSGESGQQTEQAQSSEQSQGQEQSGDSEQQSEQAQSSEQSQSQEQSGESEQQTEQAQSSEQSQGQEQSGDSEQQSEQALSSEQSQSQEQPGDSEQQSEQARSSQQSQSQEQPGDSEQQTEQAQSSEQSQGQEQPGDSEQQSEQAQSGQQSQGQEQPGESARQSEQAQSGQQSQADRQDDHGEPQTPQQEAADGQRPRELVAGRTAEDGQQPADDAPQESADGQPQREPIDGHSAGPEQQPADATHGERQQQAASGQDDAQQGPAGGGQTAQHQGAAAGEPGMPQQSGGAPETAQADRPGGAAERPGQTDPPQRPAPSPLRAPAATAPGLADLMNDQASVAQQQAAGQRVPGMDLEDQQAVEQMLRRVEDDPGGLLRQRFLLQHLRRSGRLP